MSGEQNLVYAGTNSVRSCPIVLEEHDGGLWEVAEMSGVMSMNVKARREDEIISS